MVYLLLAIAASSLVSIIMRLSTDHVKNNIAVLAVNYATCLIPALLYIAPDTLACSVSPLPTTLLLGGVNGALYLISFALLQHNIRKNGVVLSATFMKLGLLVPMAVSIAFFGEIPGIVQILGFLMAITAILLINLKKGSGAVQSGASLVLLLLCGGGADVMAKVFEEVGDPTHGDLFLLLTFVTALILSVALMLYKKQRPGRAEFLWGALIGIPNFFSAKFLLRALSDVPAVIAYPTYSVATLLVITVLGILLFGERLTRRQWIALGIILLALLLLNL